MKGTMMKIDHDRCQELIDQSFRRGGLRAPDREAMRRHVRECEPCERTYERYAAAERVLYAGHQKTGTNPGQLDRVADRLFERPPRSRTTWLPAVVAAGGLATTAAVLLSISAPSTRPEPGLRARQGEASAVAPTLGLRALRVRLDGTGPQVSDLATTGRVQRGDRVAVLYTNLAAFERVSLERRAGEDPPVVMIPMTEVETRVEDERLVTLEVDERWPSGPVTLRARFVDGSGRTETRDVRFRVETP